jgi:Protein of unknown function (DUF3684)
LTKRQQCRLTSTPTRYKAELRQVATNIKAITPTTKSSMRSAPILLGSRRVATDRVTKVKGNDKRKKEDSTPGYEEDATEIAYELLRADQASRFYLFGPTTTKIA